MSYASGAALQEAVYACLAGDAGVTAEVGQHVYDALPEGPLPDLYVLLGEERVRDASVTAVPGAWHDLTVAVVGGASGFAAAKAAAAAVGDALDRAALTLARGRLIDLRFHRARARRESGGARRIDLIFRARLEDD